MTIDSQALHDEAIIIDAVCPLLRLKDKIADYQQGGVTAIVPTMATSQNAHTSLAEIGRWHKIIRDNDSLVLIRTAADLRAAKAAGKTGVVLHFQGTAPLEDKLEFIDAFKAAGVGVMQLAYNTKNLIGDGAEERTDSGMSRFGIKAIARMNQAGVIVDCSHTGHRTALDAVEFSSAPVVISHANPRAVHDNPRNIPDDLIKAIAGTGGTIGVVGFPAFVSTDKRPTMDQFIDHIAYLGDLVGIDHVTLGIDYFQGQYPYIPDDHAMQLYQFLLASGDWSEASYPPPPYYYPEGIETPKTLTALTAALLKRGFTAEEIKKIYGENWLRIYETVWGA